MRSTRQFAAMLTVAVGLSSVSLVAAQQRNNVPQHSAAPRPSAARPQAQRSYSAPRVQRSVPRPPQVSQNTSHTAVPRPPQGPSGQTQNRNVPRPPQANEMPQQRVGNAQPAVPRPPTIGTPRDVHEGPHAGDWLRRYNSMPQQQRQNALENDPAFKRLPADQQQRYRNQLNQFSSKPAQDQQRVINRMDAWGHLTQAQKDEARNTYGQLKAMPADRQQQVNTAYRRLRSMPPSAREQVMSSPEFQSRYSEQERSVIKNMTDINSSLPH